MSILIRFKLHLFIRKFYVHAVTQPFKTLRVRRGAEKERKRKNKSVCLRRCFKIVQSPSHVVDRTISKSLRPRKVLLVFSPSASLVSSRRSSRKPVLEPGVLSGFQSKVVCKSFSTVGEGFKAGNTLASNNQILHGSRYSIGHGYLSFLALLF